MSFPDSQKQIPITISDNPTKDDQQPSEKEVPKQRKMSVFGPEGGDVQDEDSLSFLDETLSGLHAVSKMLQDSLNELEKDSAKKLEASPRPPGCNFTLHFNKNMNTFWSS